MLIYFLNYMRQKHGRFICVQILQTLNILFENIRHETSLCTYTHTVLHSSNRCQHLDYLLSNNHVNNIIVHKFDFNDEEITAYYIYFLKTLSSKLNSHSINFFFNEVGELENARRSIARFFSLCSETMISLCTSKRSSSSIIRRQWFALPCEH